jgi:hypothetical protein
MNFDLAEMPLPLRFRPRTPMSDDESMYFCAANDLAAGFRSEMALLFVDGSLNLRHTYKSVSIYS